MNSILLFLFGNVLTIQHSCRNQCQRCACQQPGRNTENFNMRQANIHHQMRFGPIHSPPINTGRPQPSYQRVPDTRQMSSFHPINISSREFSCCSFIKMHKILIIGSLVLMILILLALYHYFERKKI